MGDNVRVSTQTDNNIKILWQFLITVVVVVVSFVVLKNST